MATVTGFTSARMLEIENDTIVDGDVVGNNLILKTRDNTQIDAGNVRGIQGVPGPTGEVSTAQLNTAIENLRALVQGAEAVTTAMLAVSAVSTAKIADYAVTSIKLGADAVSSVKILNNAVTTAKINAGAVTSDKVSFIYVQSTQPPATTGGIWIVTA